MKEKLAYMGAGVGVVLFALFGLLPGSFLGGVVGLNISGMLFGQPVEAGVLERMIVALSMLTGVLVSGLIFVVAGSTLGWVVGYVVETVTKGKHVTKKNTEDAQKSV